MTPEIIMPLDINIQPVDQMHTGHDLIGFSRKNDLYLLNLYI